MSQILIPYFIRHFLYKSRVNRFLRACRNGNLKTAQRLRFQVSKFDFDAGVAECITHGQDSILMEVFIKSDYPYKMEIVIACIEHEQVFLLKRILDELKHPLPLINPGVSFASSKGCFRSVNYLLSEYGNQLSPRTLNKSASAVAAKISHQKEQNDDTKRLLMLLLKLGGCPDITYINNPDIRQPCFGPDSSYAGWPEQAPDTVYRVLMGYYLKAHNMTPSEYLPVCPEKYKRTLLMLMN